MQEFLSVEACFESYVEGNYCFEDMSGKTYKFSEMESQGMEKYDLTDGNHIGRMFIVVYKIEISAYEENEEEETEYDEEETEHEEEEIEHEDFIIVDLELIG